MIVTWVTYALQIKKQITMHCCEIEPAKPFLTVFDLLFAN